MNSDLQKKKQEFLNLFAATNIKKIDLVDRRNFNGTEVYPKFERNDVILGTPEEVWSWIEQNIKKEVEKAKNEGFNSGMDACINVSILIRNCLLVGINSEEIKKIILKTLNQ